MLKTVLRLSQMTAKIITISQYLMTAAQMLPSLFVNLDFLHKILYDITECELLYGRKNFGKEERIRQ